ncbi:HAD family hydrolase [Candidatus Bathyarchaeota archaeon]|nr:HAD family hydrolase [Candidatus Bathyarchaeota archaeon]
MHKLKLVIFDLEGLSFNDTINDVTIENLCLYEAIKEKNQKITISEVKNLLYRNPKNILKKYLPDFSYESYKKYIEFLNINIKELKEVNGVWEIFQWFKAHDIKVALVSNLPALIVKQILDNFGWLANEAYDYWICSEIVEEWRPSSIMVRRSMRHFNIWNLKEVIKVSSTPSGILEGKNAGVLTIAMKSKGYSDSELLEKNPDNFFLNFKELLGWLKENGFI